MSGHYEYIGKRIASWRDPFSDSLGDTWQTCQSLIAIGSGGLFGLGLGESRQKYLYLPETKNDFVFSIVCEELGLVGALTVVLLLRCWSSVDSTSPCTPMTSSGCWWRSV